MKKSDKDSKVTVEFKNGEVYINGKKAEEFNDDDVSVSKNRIIMRRGLRGTASPRVYSRTFPDNDQYNWSWNGDAPGAVVFNSNKAFLGVVTEKTDKGLKIVSVTTETAAEKAGLKADDIILKVGGDKVETPMDLTKAIGKYKPEDKVDIVYQRDGKENKTVAVLGKNKTLTINRSYNFNNLSGELGDAMAPLAQLDNMDFDIESRLYDTYAEAGLFRPRLGMAVQETEDGKGVKVISVEEESAAAKAGLKEGDIITEFDGKPANEAETLSKWMRDNAKPRASVTVKYTRDGKSQTAEIKIPKKLKKASL
jgi:serine protease Do